jgi:hypothetical protein
VLAVLLLLSVVGGCGGGDSESRATPSAAPSTSPSSVTAGLPTAEPSPSTTFTPTHTSQPISVSPSPGALPTFDWLDPQPLGMGEWTFSECDSRAAERVCVSRSDGAAGAIAITSSPAPAGQGTGATALRGYAEDFLADARADRQTRCGGGYSFQPNRTVVLQAGGTEVVRYGFTATNAGGSPSEVVVRYAGRVGPDLVVIGVRGRDPGGCLPAEADSLTSAEMGSLLPMLDALVRAAPFPRP